MGQKYGQREEEREENKEEENQREEHEYRDKGTESQRETFQKTGKGKRDRETDLLRGERSCEVTQITSLCSGHFISKLVGQKKIYLFRPTDK